MLGVREELLKEPAPAERSFEERAQMQALKSLEDGKVTFLKAAQLAGLSVWDFADLVQEKGIIWIKDKRFIRKDIKRALASGMRTSLLED